MSQVLDRGAMLAGLERSLASVVIDGPCIMLRSSEPTRSEPAR
jgi:hypothetical protein